MVLHPDVILGEIQKYFYKIDALAIQLEHAINLKSIEFEIESLETSFKGFIRRAFHDGQTKLEEYKGDRYPGMVLLGEPVSLKELSGNLNIMKKHLLVFREDVEQRPEFFEVMYKKEMKELGIEEAETEAEGKEVEPPDKQQDAIWGKFVAAGIFALVLGGYIGWNQPGGLSQGPVKFLIIISLVFLILGVGSYWRPEIFGPIAYYFEKILMAFGKKSEEGRNVRQSQRDPKDSPQTYAEGDVNIYYGDSEPKKRKKS